MSLGFCWFHACRCTGVDYNCIVVTDARDNTSLVYECWVFVRKISMMCSSRAGLFTICVGFSKNNLQSRVGIRLYQSIFDVLKSPAIQYNFFLMPF